MIEPNKEGGTNSFGPTKFGAKKRTWHMLYKSSFRLVQHLDCYNVFCRLPLFMILLFILHFVFVSSDFTGTPTEKGPG